MGRSHEVSELWTKSASWYGVDLAASVIRLLINTKTDAVGLCTLCHRGQWAYWKGGESYQWYKKRGSEAAFRDHGACCLLKSGLDRRSIVSP